MSVSDTFNLSGIAASAKGSRQKYVPGEVLIKFREGTRPERADRIASSHGDSPIKNMFIKKRGARSIIKHVRLKKNKGVKEAIAEYSVSPEVEYAQPNYIYHAHATYSSDPDFGSQWGLNNTGQEIGENTAITDIDIDAPEAWDTLTDCANVIVAVVDTGINYNQRDLAGNMWDGGPSYPHHGYDFSDDDDDPMDMSGHGTHVAGIIGADGANSAGLCGVCWKVRLMAVRVLDAAGDGTTANMVSGIDFAVANGAHIINYSLGDGSGDSALKAAIESARSSGVIFVASAGNLASTTYNYPAAYTNTSLCADCDNVISVGAVDPRGNLASFSSYGTNWVDIAAPGVDVLSTWAGQSITTRENFSDWTRGEDWGVGRYRFYGVYGPITFTMLTNPDRLGSSYYQPDLNSAAYKIFELDAYGAASAVVGFYIDYYLDSGDSLIFTANTTGAIPDSSDPIYSLTYETYGLEFAGIWDMAKYMGPNSSMGFLFQSNSSWESLGGGIALFETTRLYHNTTACRYISGTSMAAPHVSGVAALCVARYISKYGSYDRAANYTEIINAILNNYDYYPGLEYKIGNGRMLNASKAVQAI
ncbi:MAG: S8 family serine peptidase [Spirochaetes bacterium]|nr:S8 family serine peptidase [Spirochaetota bacterium]